jgi:hypothetical protein
MPPRDYWWVCQQCGERFEHLEPYQSWGWMLGKRRRIVVYDCALKHEADNPGHRCFRKAAPGV